MIFTRFFRRLSTRVWIALVVVAALTVGGIVAWQRSQPALEDLERAAERGEEAGTRSERIRASLEAIAENLEEASGLENKSKKIEHLTSAQRESLEGLIDLLQSQLRTLGRTSRLVDETAESTSDLARLSEAQSEELQEAIEVLKRLRDFAREAGSTSADLARSARFSARLAEDSEEAFDP
jgi:ABC-type transporter Mla subunit MlaD